MAKFGGERLAIRTGWPAYDAVVLIAGKPGGGFPWSVVRHRPLDTEDAAVMVGDSATPGD